MNIKAVIYKFLIYFKLTSAALVDMLKFFLSLPKEAFTFKKWRIKLGFL